MRFESEDGVVHFAELVATGGGHADINVLDADGNAVASVFSFGVSNSAGRLYGHLNDVSGASAHIVVDPETGYITNG